MKKRTQKGMALLSSLLLLGALAGCSNPGSSGTGAGTPSSGSGSASVAATGTNDGPLFSEPVKLSMYTASHPSWPYQEDWYVIDLVEEYTNVTFDTTAVDTEGFTEKLNLIMASGDLPDLMYLMNNQPVQQYGPQGAFVNLLEHLDEMPNFKAWYEENTLYALSYMSPDGALYQFPQHGVQETNRRGWLYRQDVFEANNLEVPTNQEEFYDVLVKLKELYPDSYPLAARSFSAQLNQFNMIAPTWGAGFINTNDNRFFTYDYDKEEWFFGPTQDSFKEMVEFYHKLYAEGLLIPNFLTIDTKGWQDVMANSDSFITLDYLSRIDFFNNSMRPSQPEFTMAYMPPASFGSQGQAMFPDSAQFISGFVISSQSKNMAEALKYVDWLYSDEAMDLLTWGRPGELYTEEADGTRKWNDFTTAAEMKQGTGLETYGFYERYNFDGELATFSPECRAATEEARKYDLPAQPMLSYTEAERSVVDTVGNNIQTHVTEQISKFLLGERPMSEWDEYVKEIEDLGLADLKAVHESSYARVLAAQAAAS